MNLKLVVLTLAVAAPAAAQLAPCIEEGGDYFAGHLFMRPALQDTAFIKTQVGIVEGIGVVTSRNLDLGSLGTRDVSLGLYQQTLDFDLRFTDWLGMSLSGVASAATGVDLPTLLAHTLSAKGSSELGLGARVLHAPATGSQLTLRLFGTGTIGREVSLRPLVENTFDRPGLTLQMALEGGLAELLLVPNWEAGLGGGIYYAQAFGRHFSLQASARLDQTWRSESPYDVAAGMRIDEDSRRLQGMVAAAFEMNFKPVALMAEYQFGFGQRTGTTILSSRIQTHTAAVGIYYSGQRHLQLGLSAVALLYGQPLVGFATGAGRVQANPTQGGYGQLALRYIW